MDPIAVIIFIVLYLIASFSLYVAHNKIDRLQTRITDLERIVNDMRIDDQVNRLLK